MKLNNIYAICLLMIFAILIILWMQGIADIQFCIGILSGISGLWTMLHARLARIQTGLGQIMEGLGVVVLSIGILTGLWMLALVASPMILVGIFLSIANNAPIAKASPQEPTRDKE